MPQLTPQDHWLPSADIVTLRLRASILATIRAFFAARDVLEVETPILATTTATEHHLASMMLAAHRSTEEETSSFPLFLQTSPESFMKRLLAAGSGPIFQITRAFRAGESGRLHNPEFTILEWYRPGLDSTALMDEVESLVGSVLGLETAARITYREAFRRHARIDPFATPLAILQDRVRHLSFSYKEDAPPERDTCLDFLLGQVVQPAMGSRPVFITAFPASQTAMARLLPDANTLPDDQRQSATGRIPPAHTGENTPLADRFELFVNGIELANGYRELGDAKEQRARFMADQERRREKNLPDVPIDERLLAALESGLPDCSGVALGVDRLVMLAAKKQGLGEAMAFVFDRI